jgi:hypothetical protein
MEDSKVLKTILLSVLTPAISKEQIIDTQNKVINRADQNVRTKNNNSEMKVRSSWKNESNFMQGSLSSEQRS